MAVRQTQVGTFGVEINDAANDRTTQIMTEVVHTHAGAADLTTQLIMGTMDIASGANDRLTQIVPFVITPRVSVFRELISPMTSH